MYNDGGPAIRARELQAQAERPFQVKRRTSAAERRAQCQRAEGRRLQGLLRQLQLIHLHRGGQLSRIGVTLLTALSAPITGEAVHFPNVVHQAQSVPPGPPCSSSLSSTSRLRADAVVYVPGAARLVPEEDRLLVRVRTLV